jgi:hypothetical protein
MKMHTMLSSQNIRKRPVEKPVVGWQYSIIMDLKKYG